MSGVDHGEVKQERTGLCAASLLETDDRSLVVAWCQTTDEQQRHAAFGRLRRLFDKWSLPILGALEDEECHRFSEVQRMVPGVTQKMLAQTLRDLEASGLVVRQVHAEVPVRVDYRLTAAGSALLSAVVPLLKWQAETGAPAK